ncbi:hypothetical protein [Amycolatopsis sp. NPDC003676]
MRSFCAAVADAVAASSAAETLAPDNANARKTENPLAAAMLRETRLIAMLRTLPVLRRCPGFSPTGTASASREFAGPRYLGIPVDTLDGHLDSPLFAAGKPGVPAEFEYSDGVGCRNLQVLRPRRTKLLAAVIHLIAEL